MTTDKFDEVELEAFQGNTETYTFSVTSGTITISTVRAQGFASDNSEDVLWDSASTTGAAITDGESGNDFANKKVVVTVPAAITNVLPIHSRYQVTANEAATPKTIAKGGIVLTRGGIR